MDEFHTSEVDTEVGVDAPPSKTSKSGKRSKFSNLSSDTTAATPSKDSPADAAPVLLNEVSAEAEVEVVETEATTEQLASPEDNLGGEPGVGLTADEWLSLCRVQLGVKPWILRAAVADESSTRRYTEGEIRSLIQRKLSEPA